MDDRVSRQRNTNENMPTPRFSVVINTLNRACYLQQSLESLRWLKYSGEFEIIVVNGPSTDNTNDVLASWQGDIRIGKCDVPNISVSRNIGICMARGDIVAFIDDDAIPEPEWLIHLAEAYEDPMVGAAGGFVFDHTGYTFQYTYWIGDRLGNDNRSLGVSTPQISFPQSYNFPYLVGCNASFRRQALLEIGGFDEEYEYNLDEIDVCLRIIDAGYIIAQQPNAYVHHRLAPNSSRDGNRVFFNLYPIIKTKIYFMLKHGRNHYSDDRILLEKREFARKQRADVIRAVEDGFLSAELLSVFDHDLERALDVGTRRGLEGVAEGALIDRNKLARYSGKFLPFKPIESSTYKSIVFVSRDFATNDGNTVVPFIMEFVESLAAKGDIVHVITQSPDINQVEFNNGVWLHRMRLLEFKRTPSAVSRNLPQDMWNWSSTALAEAKRIAGHRNIDVVEAPLWNCEGAAFLIDGTWPLVTSLRTPLHFWLNDHPEKLEDEEWMKSVGVPVIEMETDLMRRSEGIRFSNSAARDNIEKAYGLSFKKRILISPQGSPCEKPFLPEPPFSPSNDNSVEKRTAIILMTHRYDRSILDEFQRILESIGENDQAFILSDGSESPPDSIAYYVHTYNICDISRRAARTIGKGVYHNVHLPWLDLFDAHPGFEFYWFIEYDVKYSGPWRDFFDTFRSIPHDLLCTHLRPYAHEPQWAWWHEVQSPVEDSTREHHIRGFMPITRLSRKGLETFRDAVDNGLSGFYEGTLPTLIINSGLRIADMGGNGPFVPPGFKNRFYTSVSDQAGALWGAGTFRFRPPIRIPRIMPGRLYHPVKPELCIHDVIDGDTASGFNALEILLQELCASRDDSASVPEGQMEHLLQELTGLSSIELTTIIDSLEASKSELSRVKRMRSQFQKLFSNQPH